MRAAKAVKTFLRLPVDFGTLTGPEPNPTVGSYCPYAIIMSDGEPFLQGCESHFRHKPCALMDFDGVSS